MNVMPPLKVVCLISGGKDSFFSILHCLQNGHSVVALANLHPPVTSGQDAEEDLDSYMYQTVGHKIIPLYEKALGLPVYRQEIIGSALDQSKSYGQAIEHQDETESLVPLLQKVKEHHPDVNAVSTGAILSDYQRTRVESVAIRLGLTPLSYLWQWPNLPPHTESTLLEDMAAVGQDSRIVKVASGGLDSSFLWCNVADPRTLRRIDKAVKRFGSGDDGAVLGEGGEYETLAIAGPAPLWKGSIDVDEGHMEVVAGEAGSASVRISDARVVEQDTERNFEGVRTPPLLEPQFETLLEAIPDIDAVPSDGDTQNYPSSALPDHVCYQYMTGPAGKSVAEQMASIMDREALSTILRLQSPPLEFSNIAYVSIILRNMADFAAVNAIYIKAFSEPNPPARITLAEPSALPEGKDVLVSLSCIEGSPSTKRELHVQSQSYWAPANIGPYSQAISIPASSDAGEGSQRIVYTAGQIPLIPASMELASPEAAEGNQRAFAKQSVLATQHFVRIGRAMRVVRWACGIAFITAISNQDAAQKAKLARQTWTGLHRPSSKDVSQSQEDDDAEEDGFDIWNVTHGAQRGFGHVKDMDSNLADLREGGDRHIPRLEVCRVEALPRAASIEWAVYGLTAVDGMTPVIPHFEHLVKVFKDRILQ